MPENVIAICGRFDAAYQQPCVKDAKLAYMAAKSVCWYDIKEDRMHSALWTVFSVVSNILALRKK